MIGRVLQAGAGSIPTRQRLHDPLPAYRSHWLLAERFRAPPTPRATSESRNANLRRPALHAVGRLGSDYRLAPIRHSTGHPASASVRCGRTSPLSESRPTSGRQQVATEIARLPVRADARVAPSCCATGHPRTCSHCTCTGSMPRDCLLETDATGRRFRNHAVYRDRYAHVSPHSGPLAAVSGNETQHEPGFDARSTSSTVPRS